MVLVTNNLEVKTFEFSRKEVLTALGKHFKIDILELHQATFNRWLFSDEETLIIETRSSVEKREEVVK